MKNAKSLALSIKLILAFRTSNLNLALIFRNSKLLPTRRTRNILKANIF